MKGMKETLNATPAELEELKKDCNIIDMFRVEVQMVLPKPGHINGKSGVAVNVLASQHAANILGADAVTQITKQTADEVNALTHRFNDCILKAYANKIANRRPPVEQIVDRFIEKFMEDLLSGKFDEEDK